MRHALSFIIVAIAACILGVGSAWFTLQGDIRLNRVDIGQWSVWPKAGEPDADPYTKAYLARKGTTWMGAIEGLALFAVKDADGDLLRTECSYQLRGEIPRGRLWTISALGFDSALNKRTFKSSNYITSRDVIWNEDSTVDITVSRKGFPGNWLPIRSGEWVTLVLRIYDTPLTSGALENAFSTPVIKRLDCA